VGPGGYHTIILTSNNEIYTWGHNRVGQLGYYMYDSLPRNYEGAYFLACPRQVYCHTVDGSRVADVRVKQVL
jgi:alpha-tubulin suppressor-like RCC1 family protein